MAQEYRITTDNCTICGNDLAILEGKEVCPECKSRARTRAIKPVLNIFSDTIDSSPLSLSLLGFAVTRTERILLMNRFQRITSVSLYGKYGEDHQTNVDARDLSRYSDNSFVGHFSSLLFDYFTEHQVALSEARRVVAPGGIFMTHINGGRLRNGNETPFLKGQVESTKNYFNYLPKEASLPKIRVGRDWFLNALEASAFEASVVYVTDQRSGIVSDWFVGV